MQAQWDMNKEPERGVTTHLTRLSTSFKQANSNL